jgi:tRNA(Arg) A34 adenosine deaminase TadA
MSTDRDINRRDLMTKTAGAASAGALAGASVTAALAAEPLPPGFADQPPLQENWDKQLNAVVDIAVNLKKDAPELAEEPARERHRIYSHLLMKLIARFWNGNKRGPIGSYPMRAQQKDVAQTPARYRGDMIPNPGGLRVDWDRYLGHNIACIAVDGNGEIIEFDFNHNDFFRSSAEHAESRMVRRLFSLTDIFDNWQTGKSIGNKPRAASLNDVTLYTSLESCAQCSGVMSLAGVKQIVYLQNDFTAYKIGNIMYNLANRTPSRDAQGNPISLPGAPIPIAGSEIHLDEFKLLNDGNLDFVKKINAAQAANDKSGAFFVGTDGGADFSPSITSFLCTDAALKVFTAGGNKLDAVKIAARDWKPKGATDKTLNNDQCLAHAQKFYKYADVDGYRGSPHKL